MRRRQLWTATFLASLSIIFSTWSPVFSRTIRSESNAVQAAVEDARSKIEAQTSGSKSSDVHEEGSESAPSEISKLSRVAHPVSVSYSKLGQDIGEDFMKLTAQVKPSAVQLLKHKQDGTESLLERTVDAASSAAQTQKRSGCKSGRCHQRSSIHAKDKRGKGSTAVHSNKIGTARHSKNNNRSSAEPIKSAEINKSNEISESSTSPGASEVVKHSVDSNEVARAEMGHRKIETSLKSIDKKKEKALHQTSVESLALKSENIVDVNKRPKILQSVRSLEGSIMKEVKSTKNELVDHSYTESESEFNPDFGSDTSRRAEHALIEGKIGQYESKTVSSIMKQSFDNSYMESESEFNPEIGSDVSKLLHMPLDEEVIVRSEKLSPSEVISVKLDSGIESVLSDSGSGISGTTTEGDSPEVENGNTTIGDFPEIENASTNKTDLDRSNIETSFGQVPDSTAEEEGKSLYAVTAPTVQQRLSGPPQKKTMKKSNKKKPDVEIVPTSSQLISSLPVKAEVVQTLLKTDSLPRSVPKLYGVVPGSTYPQGMAFGALQITKQTSSLAKNKPEQEKDKSTFNKIPMSQSEALSTPTAPENSKLYYVWQLESHPILKNIKIPKSFFKEDKKPKYEGDKTQDTEHMIDKKQSIGIRASANAEITFDNPTDGEGCQKPCQKPANQSPCPYACIPPPPPPPSCPQPCYTPPPPPPPCPQPCYYVPPPPPACPAPCPPPPPPPPPPCPTYCPPPPCPPVCPKPPPPMETTEVSTESETITETGTLTKTNTGSSSDAQGKASSAGRAAGGASGSAQGKSGAAGGAGAGSSGGGSSGSSAGASSGGSTETVTSTESSMGTKRDEVPHVTNGEVPHVTVPIISEREPATNVLTAVSSRRSLIPSSVVLQPLNQPSREAQLTGSDRKTTEIRSRRFSQGTTMSDLGSVVPKQPEETRVQVASIVERRDNPASSCMGISNLNPRAKSGKYWISTKQGLVEVYCDMSRKMEIPLKNASLNKELDYVSVEGSEDNLHMT